MKRILFAALRMVILLAAAKTYGQPAKEIKNFPFGTVSIAVSPLTILDVEPTVNLHVMYRFNQYSAAIEVGRIIKPLDNDEDRYRSITNQFTGWRFRPEFRFWKKASNKYDRGKSYLAIQGLIKTAHEQLYINEQRRTPSGLTYIEAVDQNIHKTVLGLNGLIGEEFDLLNSKKIFADIFAGFGLRYKSFKDNIGTNFSKSSNRNYSNKNGIYPTLALGIRVGVRMK